MTVKNNRDLIDYVSSRTPGTKITIGFLRDGKEQTAVATLETRPEDGERPAASDEEEGKVSSRQKMLGLEIDDLSPRVRRAYGIDKDTTKGVVITHVKPVSPAADANLLEGDVILEVNGTAVGIGRRDAGRDQEGGEGQVHPLLRPAPGPARAEPEVPDGREARGIARAGGSRAPRAPPRRRLRAAVFLER